MNDLLCRDSGFEGPRTGGEPAGSVSGDAGAAHPLALPQPTCQVTHQTTKPQPRKCRTRASAWLTCPFSHLQVRKAAPPPSLAAFRELGADRAAVLPQDHREHSHGETPVRHVQKLRPLPRNPCSILLVLKGVVIQTFGSSFSSHTPEIQHFCLFVFFKQSLYHRHAVMFSSVYEAARSDPLVFLFFCDDLCVRLTEHLF